MSTKRPARLPGQSPFQEPKGPPLGTEIGSLRLGKWGSGKRSAGCTCLPGAIPGILGLGGLLGGRRGQRPAPPPLPGFGIRSICRCPERGVLARERQTRRAGPARERGTASAAYQPAYPNPTQALTAEPSC